MLNPHSRPKTMSESLSGSEGKENKILTSCPPSRAVGWLEGHSVNWEQGDAQSWAS